MQCLCQSLDVANDGLLRVYYLYYPIALRRARWLASRKMPQIARLSRGFPDCVRIYLERPVNIMEKYLTSLPHKGKHSFFVRSIDSFARNRSYSLPIDCTPDHLDLRNWEFY